jgi:hypothetical protein
MVTSLYKRTNGPLAEGQTLAFCGRCAIFLSVHLPHIPKWLTTVWICVFGAYSHPLYISVTEVSHNAKDRILEVSCKVFTNDLETVLEKMSGGRVDLSAAATKAATDKLIDTYVEKHLRLKVDGKPVQLHFVGSEQENDGTWSYFQVNDVSSVKRVDVVDELLYDSFNQQINILHVTVGGQRKSFRLDYPESGTAFEF